MNVSKSQRLSSDTGKLDKNTYYVRDASGNLLAVYELKQQWHTGKYIENVLQNVNAVIDPYSGSGFGNLAMYYVSALNAMGVLSDPSFK